MGNLKENIRSIYTTSMGIALSVIMVVSHLLDKTGVLGMYCGIGVGLILVFFKDEWATKLFQLAVGFFKKKTK